MILHSHVFFGGEGGRFSLVFFFNGFGAGWQFGATTKTVWRLEDTFGNHGKENMSSVQRSFPFEQTATFQGLLLLNFRVSITMPPSARRSSPAMSRTSPSS